MLFQSGIISSTVLDIPLSKKRTTTFCNAVLGYIVHPIVAIRKARNVVFHERFFGDREYHNNRILRHNYKTIDPELAAVSFNDINDEDCVSWIGQYKPDFVFVFGTCLIRRRLLEAFQCPVVNMHWGWSPDYRAEGIVSALATGGSKDLGVTVHLLDISVDGGDILYQERIVIDIHDNFYSIGLKLALRGTELFIRSYQNFEKDGSLAGMKQDTSRGKLYSGEFMRRHPQLYYQAWKNLSAEQGRL
jgi:methionyl-tRNA formyltransferase